MIAYFELYIYIFFPSLNQEEVVDPMVREFLDFIRSALHYATFILMSYCENSQNTDLQPSLCDFAELG